MKNNKTKYVIFYYDILVKSHQNDYTDDIGFIQVSILDRHYEEYTDLKSVINRSQQFKTYEQAVNKHSHGWCIAGIVDTHGKDIALPKEKVVERYHSPVRRHSQYFKHIRYKSWNEECDFSEKLKRDIRENYGVNIKARNHTLDNWENPRSNPGKGWKSRKIRRQYEKNIRKKGSICYKY